MRYIDFALDGAAIDIQVHMEEQPDGTILVRLTSVGGPIDIRGLFFDVTDPALLSSLQVSGIDITSFQTGDESVMNLGHGVNMHGGGRQPFDVGVEFGTAGHGFGMVTSTNFILSSTTGPLTLDLLSLVDFGVRLQGSGAPPKLVEIAPAAPDAIADSFDATEDETIVFDVLANDTDADGTGDFRIVSVTDPEHGTATISDDGTRIIYTPDANYSGADSFGYSMIDGHGGGDDTVAAIAVAAVADAPTLTLTTAAGADVNHIAVTVSAAVTDTDGSEYIDRFVFSGLPDGASVVGEGDLLYDPSSTGGTLTRTFVVELAANTDFDFDFTVTAVSREQSNGSEATTTDSVGVLVDSNSNDFSLNFTATDQSIWNAGDAFQIVDDRFIGFTFDPPEATSGGFIYGYADLYLKAGLQSTLTFDAGSIDAEAPWNVGIDTTYNHTTDVMLIESFTDLMSSGVTFSTTGPGGSYVLDFIFNYAISAGLGIDFEVDSYDLFSFGSSNNFTVNLLTVDSEDLSLEFEFPYGLSITLAWPDVDTTSLVSTTGSNFTSSGESNNFFDLGLDVDDALADIFFGGVNPFSFGFDITVAWGSADILDVDLNAGMNFLQDFVMSLTDLDAVLEFENGSTVDWDFSDLVLTGASAYDADSDGVIEFDLTLDQQADLTNTTSLGFNWGYSVALLQASGGWDFGVDSGSWSEGPLWSTSGSFPIAAIELFNSKFDLNFESQTISFVGNEHPLV
ncbi:MAG TPA: Ig-like domain-containing protein [Sphingomicrobium sp.]|nr:Ig-like domain-containing protein [Sphingomicrobium sp.]